MRMATKNRNGKGRSETVEIDRETYQRLEEVRTEGETLSDVIKRYVRPKQTAEEILRVMRRAAVSPATLQSIEASATRRRRSAYNSKG